MSQLSSLTSLFNQSGGGGDKGASMKRMPTMGDPDVEAAALRARAAALRRTGRLSTILTDQTRDVVGYGAGKLGA
jgi:hypothetical protein